MFLILLANNMFVIVQLCKRMGTKKRDEHKVRPYVITLLHSYIYLFTIFAILPSALTV